MSAKASLEPAERTFFELLLRVVVMNPFDAQREVLDRELLEEDWSPRFPARMAAIQARAVPRIEALAQTGRGDLRTYGKEDRELLRYALLFDIYFDLYERIDELILRQEQAGDEPCAVPFAAEALERLAGRGYSTLEARKNLALFFQIRRAFTFIDRALIGRSPCMQALRQALWNNIFTRDIRWFDAYLVERMEDFSTLLLGETGTGKGAAAGAIGRCGFIPYDATRERFVESFTRAFVSLNLTQFPESLVESELFGHKKGAFTGATEDYLGVFASCSPHGAIFLDEIGEIEEPLQIKLLQVLQERRFKPVGSRKARRFRGRVIAATNVPLAELRAEDGFRDDFFYRLCSDVIEIPPLRQRLAEAPDELEELVAFVLRRMLGTNESKLLDMVHGTIVRELGAGYAWPGNVRELEQCVRRILLKGHYESQESGAGAPTASGEGDDYLRELALGTLDAQQVLAGYCARLYAETGSYQEVARRTRLDRRTAKKYVEQR